MSPVRKVPERPIDPAAPSLREELKLRGIETTEEEQRRKRREARANARPE